MASIPDPSASSSAPTPDIAATHLESGLAALKRKDYPTAIAYLEPIAQGYSDQPLGLRAQVGLVAAYEKQGQTDQAIALCQSLVAIPNPSIQTWAQRTLAEFTTRYPDRLPASATASTTASPDLTDRSGFVPMDQSTSTTPRSPASTVQPRTRNQPGGNQPTRKKLSRTKASQLPEPAAIVTNPAPPDSLSASELDSPNLLDPADPINPKNPNVQAEESSTRAVPTWRQAGRAQKWAPLRKMKLARLRLVQAGSAIAFLWFALVVLKFALAAFNLALVKLPWLEPIQLLYRDPTQPVLILAGLVLVLLPWLMDGLLKLFYGLQPLPMTTLAASSQEATKVLNRLTRQHKIALPQLKLLPVAAPLAFTYGNLPRTARIVISQGLLEQLSEDEIATLCAAEVAHIAQWDFVVMSWAMLLLQIPYTLYAQVAKVGDWLEARRQAANNIVIVSLWTILFYLALTVSSVSYGFYQVFRWPMLWLSRLRLYYSDRVAAEFTGNPNGLTRALLKIAIGLANDIEQQRQTRYLLEAIDLLTPMGYKAATSVGSIYPHALFETILEWDRVNPYRHWLVLNNSHPLTGDRLQVLMLYARHWRLETELDWAEPAQRISTKSGFASIFAQNWRPLLLQGAPYFGLLFGLALGLFFWLVGAISDLLNIWQFIWMAGHRWLLIGCLPIGMSLGIFIRINAFFPDIKPANLRTAMQLPNLLANSTALPADSQPVQLQGVLLGRPGTNNRLGQDLVLQTPTGLIRLHHRSPFGPLGNFWPKTTIPEHLVNQSVTVKGWFRRGATAWIDLESMRTPSGKTSNSGHPIWSTITASALALLGVYIFFKFL